MTSSWAIARRGATAVAAALATVASGGCYRYTPVSVETPTLGSDVRVALTDAGAVALAPLIGNRVETVDGRIVASSDSALTLAVSNTTDRRGAEFPWAGEKVSIPRAAIDQFQRRSFDRGRSYLAGGIAAALVAAAGIGFSVVGSGENGQGGSTGSAK